MRNMLAYTVNTEKLDPEGKKEGKKKGRKAILAQGVEFDLDPKPLSLILT